MGEAWGSAHGEVFATKATDELNVGAKEAAIHAKLFRLLFLEEAKMAKDRREGIERIGYKEHSR